MKSSSRNLYGVRKTAVGLVFTSASLPADAWRSMLGEAVRDYSTSRWQIGDLLNHGEAAAYGKTYDEAIAETGLTYQTVANLRWVAGKIEFSRRRESLSFAHHAEVAALLPAEQVRLLDLAAKSGWSRAVLREQVTQARAPTAPVSPPRRTILIQPVTHTISIPLPKPDVTYTPWPKAPEKINEGATSTLLARLDFRDHSSEPRKLSLDDAIREGVSYADRFRHLPETAEVIAAINKMKTAFEEQDKKAG